MNPSVRRRTRAARLAVACLPVVALPWVPLSASASSSTTVPAPAAGSSASVTVSKTDNVVNESVRVSWVGFRPSSSDHLSNGTGSYDTDTTAPVRVYECRGNDPSSSSDCYGSPGFSGVPASDNDPGSPAVPGFTYPGQTDPHENNPDGPPNFQDTVTAGDGTGVATIQVFTKREAPSLGCDDTTPCSVVVVPNYGRDNGSGATEDSLDAAWAWARRTVVPLHFAPVGAACPFSDAAVSVEGSPAASRLFASWRVGACNAAKSPVAVDFTAIGEPQARQDVAAGFSQVGLTSRPLPSTDVSKAHLGYAPVAVSGLVVAFQIDDANGQPVTSLKLNARLVAKLITASYRVADDPNVDGNPANLFHDPEFRALNPGISWPSGSPGNHPILLADLSDLTWTLTRWIDHDKDARAFLNGVPDPYGMHVNLAYKGLKLPVATFPVLDQKQSDIFAPIQGLDQVARQLSIAQFPGATTVEDNGQTVVVKPSRQNPGGRQVIGIVDSADAASFLLPTASLQNTSGSYVAPTPQTMAAALAHMTVGPDGVTRSVDLSSDKPDVYPLTMVTDAIVPLHASSRTARSVADMLGYAAGPGQVSGDELGRLPAGYLPLPKDLLALNREARTAVLARSPEAGSGGNGSGSGAHSSGHGSTGGGAPRIGGAGDAVTPPVAAGDVPSGGSVAAPGQVPAVAADAGTQRLAGVRSTVPGGWLLPTLGLLGLVFVIAGPLLLHAPRLAAAREQLTRLRPRRSA